MPSDPAHKSLSRLVEFEKEPTGCYINKAYAIEDSCCNAKRVALASLKRVQSCEARSALLALSGGER